MLNEASWPAKHRSIRYNVLIEVNTTPVCQRHTIHYCLTIMKRDTSQGSGQKNDFKFGEENIIYNQ